MNYYVDVLKKYAVFSGRATRKEYWMFVLFNVIIFFVLAFISNVIKTPILTIIYDLGVLIPSIAVAVRRLQDTGKSGWWILISLVPFVGGIIALVLLALDGQPGENKYGPDPKMPKAA